MKLAGELDSATCRELITRFEQLVADGAASIDLDLGAVTFVDSAGLRAIIMIERMAGQRSVALTISSPAGPVADLLDLTGIQEHVALAPQVDDPPPAAPFLERIELELARTPSAPAQARAELREALVESLGETDRATLTLLTSELVTNAVIHSGDDAGKTVGLRITTYADRVRVEVTDGGSGFEVGALPPRPRDYGGHGLVVVEGLSSRWGTTRTGPESGFCVWFEYEFTEAAAGEAVAGSAAGSPAGSAAGPADGEQAEPSVAAEG